MFETAEHVGAEALTLLFQLDGAWRVDSVGETIGMSGAVLIEEGSGARCSAYEIQRMRGAAQLLHRRWQQASVASRRSSGEKRSIKVVTVVLDFSHSDTSIQRERVIKNGDQRQAAGQATKLPAGQGRQEALTEMSYMRNTITCLSDLVTAEHVDLQLVSLAPDGPWAALKHHFPSEEGSDDAVWVHWREYLMRPDVKDIFGLGGGRM